MQDQEIFDWLKKTLSESFDIDPALIKPEARLMEDLDIDSIDAVDIMVKLKQQTGRRLQPEAFKSVRTIQDVVTAVRGQLE